MERGVLVDAGPLESGPPDCGGPIKEPREFYVTIKLGGFDLYGQEMNTWAA